MCVILWGEKLEAIEDGAQSLLEALEVMRRCIIPGIVLVDGAGCCVPDVCARAPHAAPRRLRTLVPVVRGGALPNEVLVKGYRYRLSEHLDLSPASCARIEDFGSNVFLLSGGDPLKPQGRTYPF